MTVPQTVPVPVPWMESLCVCVTPATWGLLAILVSFLST